MLIKCRLTKKISFIIIFVLAIGLFWFLFLQLQYCFFFFKLMKFTFKNVFKSIFVPIKDIFCFALPADKVKNATISNKFIPPGAINWWILDVRVTAVLRDSRLGLSPFLLLSGEGSRWLILELVTVVLLWQIVNDWVWLVLFGGPFCELDNTPNFWLRNVKFWT